jgi:uncharacterized repeat protein (TIGR02543 family)
MKGSTSFVILCILTAAVLIVPLTVRAADVCEDFEAGYSLGSTIGTHADWYDGGNGPVVNSGLGLAGSVGLAPGNNIFTWTAQPFDWNAPDFLGVVLQLDFQSNSSGTGNAFNDDRVGWMIYDDDISSDHIFGIQFDDSDNKIEGYWDGKTSNDRKPLITTWSPKRSTWYRLRVEITALTDTSARIDVNVHELNADGSIAVADVATGTIPDTDLLGDDVPHLKYFTAATLWPGFKNYDSSSDGAADNACVEILTAPPVENWLAYNDCVYESPQYLGSNVTTFGVGSGFGGATSGELTDQPTGGHTGATATLTESGGVIWQPSSSSGGHDPDAGTDAYNTFHGLADMTGVIYYGSSAGWTVDLTFTGLDPGKVYNFATSAARCGSGGDYAQRKTIYTISGVDASTNSSSSGVDVISPTSVAFVTGTNEAEGYIAQWTDIDPGADGSFVVRAEPHSSSPDGGRKAYAFDVFMLQETDGVTPQYTLTVNTMGNGSVTLDPPGGLYDAGTPVELTAEADPGWTFSGWSGDLGGSDNPETIVMNGDKNVTATFTELQVLSPGDVIISAVQSWNSVGGQDPAEFVELFNTTDGTISLANMELISRTDNNSDGNLEIDWQLSADLTGKTIAPYSFFLIAESGVAAPSGVHDVEVDMDLATGEGGFEERAIGLELIVDEQHMDHFLYGRHDGSDTGANPNGDVAWSSFPRFEVIRNTLGTSSFQEGLISRQTAEDLHAGYDVLGYYTDEDVLVDGYPNGVWYSPHDNTNGSYQARNSLSAAVPPPLPQQSLTVNVVGNGQVYLDPPGGTYDQGTEVTLTAVPDLGSFFDAWSGDLTGSANPETIQMDGDKNVTATFPVNPNTIILQCETFESGFTLGQMVGAHEDWFDDGGGPVVTAGNGLAGSIGLAPASNIFIWTGQKFWWTAGGLQSVTFQMDFQTDGSGLFDDDRAGWMITEDDVSSSNIFGAQLDISDGGIVTYWRNSADERVQVPIVALPGLAADAWYRFRVHIAKLAPTAAGIDVLLLELDSGGAEVALTAHGTIANTADMGDDAPDLKYFTGPIWPAYKNFTSAGAPADNACFELELIPPTAVELAAFEAVAGDAQVTLTWRTVAEINSHSFHIYRDGSRIATLSAFGQAHDYIWVDRQVFNGRSYSYRLSEVDASGRETVHPVVCTVTPTTLPVSYTLSQNYPNPFNPTTKISYSLPQQIHVTLKIYNLLGQELATLVDGQKEAGRHTVSWDARGHSSGIYFYRLETEDFSASRKMVFMK